MDYVTFTLGRGRLSVPFARRAEAMTFLNALKVDPAMTPVRLGVQVEKGAVPLSYTKAKLLLPTMAEMSNKVSFGGVEFSGMKWGKTVCAVACPSGGSASSGASSVCQIMCPERAASGGDPPDDTESAAASNAATVASATAAAVTSALQAGRGGGGGGGGGGGYKPAPMPRAPSRSPGGLARMKERILRARQQKKVSGQAAAGVVVGTLVLGIAIFALTRKK